MCPSRWRRYRPGACVDALLEAEQHPAGVAVSKGPEETGAMTSVRIRTSDEHVWVIRLSKCQCRDFSWQPLLFQSELIWDNGICPSVSFHFFLSFVFIIPFCSPATLHPTT